MPTATETQKTVQKISPEFIQGFTGRVKSGFVWHPNHQDVIYSIGSEVIIRNLSNESKKQTILKGHNKEITCLAVSPDGKFLATGEETSGGFKADLILWDLQEKKLMHRFNLHKVRVEAVAFSPCSTFAISLGGQDDNGLILWNVQEGKAVSGAVASRDSSGATLCLGYCRKDSYQFVTGGEQVIRVWNIDKDTLKMTPTECQTGQTKRVINCVSVDFHDDFFYCGTSTGDLLQISLATGLFKRAGPSARKDFFQGGITAVKVFAAKGLVYVGSGAGFVASIDINSMNVLKRAKLNGPITSIALRDRDVYASTSLSDIYKLNNTSLDGTLVASNHFSAVHSVQFPPDSSDILLTASDKDIRIWNFRTHSELLRISEPDVECCTAIFKKDGSSIISGWTDGKIRAYGPQSGTLQYEIDNAHKSSVTSLCVSNNAVDGAMLLLSGGSDGEVRVWEVTKSKQQMKAVLKEHKGKITDLNIRKNDQECVSSSADGSCIMWDLKRLARIQMLLANSSFQAANYFPDESQLLTCTSDGTISYWEVFDGSSLRNLDSVMMQPLNSFEITRDGQFFVVGGADRQLKIYHYDEGVLEAVCEGHSADITKVAFSPDQRYIVSASSDGAVFIWKNPKSVGKPLQAIE